MEIWKNVASAPRYQASSMGRIKGFRGIIAGYKAKGYLRSTGNINGKRQEYTLHRLVAEAFCERPDGCDFVNHKNGNRLDNRPENLEWCSFSGNVRHAVAVLGRECDVLTPDAVRQIRELRASGLSQKAVARQLGLNPHTTRDVITGRSWGWLT